MIPAVGSESDVFAVAGEAADTTGSLEPGKFADLIVTDKDITEIPVWKIGAAKVVATLLQGSPVFDAEELFTM